MNLRLLTYNIHKCIGGLDRRYRPARVFEAIAHYEPDLVFLQEVDAGANRSNRDRQFDLLAEMTGLRHRVWYPNHWLRGGGAYGNAILSRFPLVETTHVDLTLRGRKRRSVLHARARVRLGARRRARTVHLFNLHLGLLERDRRRQLIKFLDCHPFVRLHRRTPIVVAGDFNDLWGTIGRDVLSPAGFKGPKNPIRTFPAWAPVRALDSVYLRGDVALTDLHTARLAVARQASDHLPLVADLEVRRR